MNNELNTKFSRITVAKIDHFAKLIAGIYVKQREGDATGVERLLRKAKEYRGIFSDGIEQNWPLTLGHDFTKNVNALGFEFSEMG